MRGLGILLAVAVTSTAEAGVRFFDVTADPVRWEEALDRAGAEAKPTVDFGLLPDFGIRHPIPNTRLCSEGNDIIPPGFIPENLCFFTPVMDHMDYVGPSAGFGNPKNAVLAGYFTDSYSIDPLEPKIAVELFTLTLLGGDVVDLTVYNEDGIQIGGLPAADAPATGHRWGILATDGDSIGEVNIFDPGNGAEGIMDVTVFLPEPGSVLLIGLPAAGLLVLRRRCGRRRL